MTILILNWRDKKNPFSGGAEEITTRYAEYWVSKGHTVIWITNEYKGSTHEEVVNGVRYIRVGPGLQVPLLQLMYKYPLFLINAMKEAVKVIRKENVDTVIDEIHGLPFFTPLYSGKRNVLLVCEVAGLIWDKMFPFPVNVLGKLSERIVYELYKKEEIWAISVQTKSDVKRLTGSDKIKVLPLGISVSEIKRFQSGSPKTKHPSAVFVGRIVKMKGIESAVLATKFISETYPDFELVVIGAASEQYLSKLKELVVKLKIENNIRFAGRVSESEKFEAFEKAHFLFHPSYKEGFGLTVLEAFACGTPVIARRGSAMNELVSFGEDGYLVEKDSDISDFFIAAFERGLVATMSEKAKIKAENYDWEKVFRRSDSITRF